MRWPWPRRNARRLTPATPASSPCPATPAAPAEWRSLPPMTGILTPHPVVIPYDHFALSLTTWHNPSFLAPLTHQVTPEAPSGLIHDTTAFPPNPFTPPATLLTPETSATPPEPRTHPRSAALPPVTPPERETSASPVIPARLATPAGPVASPPIAPAGRESSGLPVVSPGFAARAGSVASSPDSATPLEGPAPPAAPARSASSAESVASPSAASSQREGAASPAVSSWRDGSARYASTPPTHPPSPAQPSTPKLSPRPVQPAPPWSLAMEPEPVRPAPPSVDPVQPDTPVGAVAGAEAEALAETVTVPTLGIDTGAFARHAHKEEASAGEAVGDGVAPTGGRVVTDGLKAAGSAPSYPHTTVSPAYPHTAVSPAYHQMAVSPGAPMPSAAGQPEEVVGIPRTTAGAPRWRRPLGLGEPLISEPAHQAPLASTQGASDDERPLPIAERLAGTPIDAKSLSEVPDQETAPQDFPLSNLPRPVPPRPVSPRSDPPRSDPPRSDPPGSVPVWSDASRSDPLGAVSPRPDLTRTDSPTLGSPGAVPPRSGTPQPDFPKLNSSRLESSGVDVPRAHTLVGADSATPDRPAAGSPVPESPRSVSESSGMAFPRGGAPGSVSAGGASSGLGASEGEVAGLGSTGSDLAVGLDLSFPGSGVRGESPTLGSGGRRIETASFTVTFPAHHSRSPRADGGPQRAWSEPMAAGLLSPRTSADSTRAYDRAGSAQKGPVDQFAGPAHGTGVPVTRAVWEPERSRAQAAKPQGWAVADRPRAQAVREDGARGWRDVGELERAPGEEEGVVSEELGGGGGAEGGRVEDCGVRAVQGEWGGGMRVDELVETVYEALLRRLRAEFRLERERRGLAADPGLWG